MKTFALLFILGMPVALIAEELPPELTIKDVLYHDVKFMKRDEVRVTFSHNGGIAAAKIKDLPDEVRAGFKYNAEKADELLRAERARNKAKYEAEDAEWKRRQAAMSEQSVDQDAPELKEQIELLDFEWGILRDYARAEGRVRNISDETMPSVKVTVSFFDDRGQFITYSTAVVETNPLRPGEVTTWKVMEPIRSGMASASVEFSEYYGPKYKLKDSSKPRKPYRSTGHNAPVEL